MRSALFVLGFFVLLAAGSQKGLAQNEVEEEASVLSNPTLYERAPMPALVAKREAVRRFIQAQCEIREAMKASSDRATEHIRIAAAVLEQAATKFGEVAEVISSDVSFDFSTESEILDQQFIVLMEEGVEAPYDYYSAISVLQQESEKGVQILNDISYSGDPDDDMSALIRLRNESGRLARIFVAVSVITRLGTS